ncbi:DsbA family protein [Rhizobacter sp. J219]|uniref:DsbA family protein n=1 Tax=Rhizobacter sp. J219 TaxID=2898430 RepID=UPI0021517EC1|nr:DsbA family protein [Rhizobacter sp. J219]MCR5885328.1 DsbA family protein [Rhizobacter sp. J219]
MKHLRFSFDPISPFAYLAFERLPQVLEGLSYSVRYEPILLAGLLQHWGQKGPAEILPKRDWTYRQVLWLGHSLQLPLQMPAAHPFNPLALLRLLLATAPAGGTPNRWACEQVLHHVWRGGVDAGDATRLEALSQRLAPQRDAASAEVKDELKAATAAAAARGLFGVPTVEVDGKLFWGLDGLPMLSAYLRGEPWFDGPDWAAVSAIPAAAQRKH